jgi:hypothetical protein
VNDTEVLLFIFLWIVILGFWIKLIHDFFKEKEERKVDKELLEKYEALDKIEVIE